MEHELRKQKRNTAEAVQRCFSAGQIKAQPAPQEPCVLQRANELRNHVLDLGNLSDQLYGILLGSGPEASDKCERDPMCDGFEGVLADTCQRAANLCGYLRTINGRLAG
jgi:hypothetical protein